jgi:hypothetical protein
MRISRNGSLAALVALASTGIGLDACSVTSTTINGNPDAGPAATDGGGDAAVLPTGPDAAAEAGPEGGSDSAAAPDAARSPLPFAAANITWPAVDLSMVQDETVSTTCQIHTEMGGAQDCFSDKAVDFVVTQSDLSKLHVFVVKSLRVEAAGVITFNNAGLPVAIVTLGDMTVLGAIDASNGTAGGRAMPSSAQAGAGPGGGAAGTDTGGTAGTGAGGASYCGQGGQGGQDMSAGVSPGARAAAYGSALLVPLLPGSSGGGAGNGGGNGGGAVELVAGGTFTMNAGSSVTAGGGGGGPGGTIGQGANGGGSGGAILIEATTVSIAGTVAANGGGGGGGSDYGSSLSGTAGGNATASATPTPGGMGVTGGNGSGGAAADGTTGASATNNGASGGGGGGAGRVRIASMSGAPTLASATLSPSRSDAGTSCATVGGL